MRISEVIKSILMKIFEAVKSALFVIGSHRLRSILTILGIVIGIAGVIAMMSVGNGAKKLLVLEIENVGGPSMFGMYRPGWIQKDGRWQRNKSKHHITYEDLELIRSSCPDVAMATPETDDRVRINAQGEYRNSRMKSTTLDFQYIRRWYSELGRFISDDDVSMWKKVCVIGSKVFKELFEGVNPIGREIKINNERFTIVGVMESQGREIEEDSEDNRVIIPFTTAQTRFWGHRYIPHILMKAKDINSVERAMSQVEMVMLRNHNGDKFFRMWSLKKEMESANKIILIIEVVLVIIASVSLVVAGIGILNIMLVSVTERIKEIGLRKAVGAKRNDIALQFLVESVVLCLIGSFFGILLGALVGHGFAWAVSKFIIKEFQWPSVISVGGIVIAVLVSVIIGVFFGSYPAIKAAKLSPIEAIRHQ